MSQNRRYERRSPIFGSSRKVVYEMIWGSAWTPSMFILIVNQVRWYHTIRKMSSFSNSEDVCSVHNNNQNHKNVLNPSHFNQWAVLPHFFNQILNDVVLPQININGLVFKLSLSWAKIYYFLFICLPLRPTDFAIDFRNVISGLLWRLSRLTFLALRKTKIDGWNVGKRQIELCMGFILAAKTLAFQCINKLSVNRYISCTIFLYFTKCNCWVILFSCLNLIHNHSIIIC